jgi:hypothetical protein
MNPPPDEAVFGAITRLERDVAVVFRDKASRREHDVLAGTVRAQGEQIDGLVEKKADRTDVSEIRGDVEALRRAIVVGSISICVAIVGSAAGYWFLGMHP